MSLALVDRLRALPAPARAAILGRATPEQLAAHYPDHDAYVTAVTKSADAAVADGFLQQATADALIAEAKKADIPS